MFFDKSKKVSKALFLKILIQQGIIWRQGFWAFCDKIFLSLSMIKSPCYTIKNLHMPLCGFIFIHIVPGLVRNPLKQL
jgi:hypothetical protein